MLDKRFVRDNPDKLKEALEKRGYDISLEAFLLTALSFAL